MPYQRNPHFTGRDELLDKLYVRISETRPKQYNHRIALYGLGGVGKTQGAIEYAYRNEKLYERTYWISAVDEAALLSGFQEIASLTKCVTGATDLKPTDVAKRVLMWLSQQTHWLIIFDNLNDVSIVKEYLPATTGKGHTLITTRNPNAMSIPAEGLEIGVLDVRSASDLLLRRSGVPIDSKAEAEAAKIVAELGFLPLAIEQAAGYIREAWKDISTFLPMYQTHRKELHRRRPSGNWDYKSSISTTWLLAFTTIEREEPLAGKLLQLFAFLNPDLILIDFLQAGVEGLPDDLREVVGSPAVFYDTLSVLERFSLIKRSYDGIVIHRLVQTVIRDDMTESELRRLWKATLRLCYVAFPKSNTQSRTLARRFQDQVTILLSTPASENSNELGEVLGEIGTFLRDDGKYNEAEAYHLKSVQVFSSVLTKNDPVLLTALHKLEGVYRISGKFQEAVRLGEKTLKARTIVLGEAHPDTLSSLAGLAWIYHNQGRLGDAQRLQEQCLTLNIQVLGERHPQTLRGLNTLGSIYHSQGYLDHAQKLHEQCLDFRIQVLGEKHPETLVSMHNLAWTYQTRGRLVDAEKLQERCLDIMIQVRGEKHPDTFYSMNCLAQIYKLRGRLVDAQRLQEKCSDFRIQLLGEKHPASLAAMSNLAQIYQIRGRLDDAQKLQERCLELKVQVQGEKHPNMLKGLSNLALIYQDQGHLEDAQRLQEDCLKSCLNMYGKEHFDALTEMTNLAVTYRLQGRLADALQLEEKSFKAKRRIFRDEYPHTMKSIMNLTAIYLELGMIDETIVLEEKNLNTKRRVLGVNHYEIMDSEKLLAKIYCKRDQLLKDLKVDNVTKSEFNILTKWLSENIKLGLFVIIIIISVIIYLD